jgi:alpha/beta superfamily hydrolase
MNEAEAAANGLLAAFGFSAVISSDFIRNTTDKLVYMASCAPLNDAYEAVSAF